jgi:hypothetical protein
MKNKFLIIASSVLLGLSSCKKVADFGDLNTNTILEEYNTTQAFRGVLTTIYDNTVWYSGITRIGSLYSQYFAETQYTDASRYIKQNVDWDGFYAGPLFECQNIIKANGTKNQFPNQTAAARIIKAYYFSFLTDMYGDIPFSGALQGEGKVAYDKQATIYPALIAELKAANNAFTTGTVEGDILNGGSIAKWKKFANSLRMMLAMRWVKADPTTAQAAFLDAHNDAAGHIATNADNVQVNYPGGSYNNPFYQYYKNDQRDDYAVSNTFMAFLNSTNDKRAASWTTSSTGFPYGWTRDNAVGVAAGWSKMMKGINTPDVFPGVLLSAGYIGLIKAEAAQRGWIATNANTLYDAAVTASWNQWGATNATDLAAYLANSQVNFATAPDNATKLQRIYRQYWVTNYPSGWLGWADMRRTDFPSGTALATPQATSKALPKRIPYGPNERTLNVVNHDAAAAAYTAGGETNSQDGAVHWDQ